MANNRLYIRCNSCGKTLFLGKHFGGELHNAFTTIDMLNGFYHKHYYCDPERAYDFELCEEFPIEMTNNPVDCDGVEISEENSSYKAIYTAQEKADLFRSKNKKELFSLKLDELFKEYESVKDILVKDEPSLYEWNKLLNTSVYILKIVSELYLIK